MSENVISRYAYPNGVLINYENIRDEEELESYERQVTLDRLVNLEIEPIKGKFDLKHLQEIHEYIFQDIYPNAEELKSLAEEQGLKDKRAFVGVLRDEDIFKGYFRFAPALHIKTWATDLFKQLKQENYLKDLEYEKFVQRLAYYMAEINVLHPFREGNGRSTREFIRELADFAGYKLNWSSLDATKLLNASIKSVSDTTDLIELLNKSLTRK